MKDAQGYAPFCIRSSPALCFGLLMAAASFFCFSFSPNAPVSQLYTLGDTLPVQQSVQELLWLALTENSLIIAPPGRALGGLTSHQGLQRLLEADTFCGRSFRC